MPWDGKSSTFSGINGFVDNTSVSKVGVQNNSKLVRSCLSVAVEGSRPLCSHGLDHDGCRTALCKRDLDERLAAPWVSVQD